MASKMWITVPDRSKYRNPDMPVGYERRQPRLVYKEGREYNGRYSRWAEYILETNYEEREDVDTLHIWIPCDEECSIEAEVQGKKSKEASPIKIKKEKDEDVSKYDKKSHEKSSDTLNTSFSEHDESDNEEKKKSSKKSHKSVYKSDDSSSSSMLKQHKHRSSSRKSPSTSKHDKLVPYASSPSPPPSEIKSEVKVKQEVSSMPPATRIETSDGKRHLFGDYHCDICNVSMNRQDQYNNHIVGKKHLKVVKSKNISEALLSMSLPPAAVSEDQSKYPKPPKGVLRKRVQKPAAIQSVIERDVKVPCPGLNLVTEIQGLSRIQYFCSICDTVCDSDSIIAHLTGFKHQLNSVKVFKPGMYEKIQDQPKYKIDNQIRNLLRAIEKKDGMGRVAVEAEELATETMPSPHSPAIPSTSRHRDMPSTSRHTDVPSTSRHTDVPSTSRHTDVPSTSRDRDVPSTRRDYPSTSKALSSKDFAERLQAASVPDRDASDFRCNICQAHMNNDNMWESHIRGKRHLANVRKHPGQLPSKAKTVAVRKKAVLLKRIREECPDEPFVGLKDIRETEIPDANTLTYQCFLCGSTLLPSNIIEHLISFKHRSKYLERINYPNIEVIEEMSEFAASSLVRDMCIEVEAKEGSGKPEVHISKSTLVYR